MKICHLKLLSLSLPLRPSPSHDLIAVPQAQAMPNPLLCQRLCTSSALSLKQGLNHKPFLLGMIDDMGLETKRSQLISAFGHGTETDTRFIFML